MERYHVFEKNPAGEGTYGIVYKAIDRKNNETVAVKVSFLPFSILNFFDGFPCRN
jgi:serine/threonine protein kinase